MHLTCSGSDNDSISTTLLLLEERRLVAMTVAHHHNAVTVVVTARHPGSSALLKCSLHCELIAVTHCNVPAQHCQLSVVVVVIVLHRHDVG
jgi:hypothetical protein